MRPRIDITAPGVRRVQQRVRVPLHGLTLPAPGLPLPHRVGRVVAVVTAPVRMNPAGSASIRPTAPPSPVLSAVRTKPVPVIGATLQPPGRSAVSHVFGTDRTDTVITALPTPGVRADLPDGYNSAAVRRPHRLTARDYAEALATRWAGDAASVDPSNPSLDSVKNAVDPFHHKVIIVSYFD